MRLRRLFVVLVLPLLVATAALAAAVQPRGGATRMPTPAVKPAPPVPGATPPPAATISTRTFEEPVAGAPVEARDGEDAATGGAAAGYFRSQDAEFGIADAYAFRSEEFHAGGRTIAVAISNAGFNREFIDQYWNRKELIDGSFADDDTAVVYFLFSPEGRFEGYSFELDVGNGCGFCDDPAVQSSVELAGGRLVGTLSLAGSPRSFDVRLDVPLSSDDHGKELGAGGGAPGAAYLALHAAIAKGDFGALRGMLSAERIEDWSEASRAGQGEAYLGSFVESHPRTVRIARGFATADRALLLLVGEGPEGSLRGEAILRLEQKGWRLHDEIFRAVAAD